MENSLKQIDARIAHLHSIIKKCGQELDELEIARRVILKLNGTEPPRRPSGEASVNALAAFAKANAENAASGNFTNWLASPPRKTKTTKEIIIQVLIENNDPWMIASDIQEAASRIKGSEIPMSTLSPTLTTLKDEGSIVRDGQKVAYAPRITGEDLV